ncbi:MAG: chemotaxis protein CheB [Deltaproteobacteria bacterium]|nr:chemotaxis protein CheB [Deltaproteobacteria bacterium]
MNDFPVVVIGTSAGGLDALRAVLPALPVKLPRSVIVVQHRSADADNFLAEFFNDCCRLPVAEAEEKELIRPGHIYFAPAAYHLLIERDMSFSLSVDEKVNFSRPSIDVLFESAAQACGARLIGVILTGANADGAAGLQTIREAGGLAVVQQPVGATAYYMPQAAINAGPVDYIMELAEISDLIRKPPCPKNTRKY